MSQNNTAETYDDEIFDEVAQEAEDAAPSFDDFPEYEVAEESEPLVAPAREQQAASGSSGKRGGGFMGGMAMMFALSATAGVGYNWYEQQNFYVAVDTAFTEVDSNIGAMGGQLNEIQANMQRLTTRIEADEAALNVAGSDLQSNLDTIRAQVMQLSDRVVAQQRSNSQSLLGLDSQTAQFDQQVQALVSELDSLKANMEKQKVDNVKAVAKVNDINRTAAPAAAPKPSIPTWKTLDGSSLIQMDTWGRDQFAIFSNKAGNLDSVAIGDTYAGWTLKTLDTDKGIATFTKGGHTVRVKQS